MFDRHIDIDRLDFDFFINMKNNDDLRITICIPSKLDGKCYPKGCGSRVVSTRVHCKMLRLFRQDHMIPSLTLGSVDLEAGYFPCVVQSLSVSNSLQPHELQHARPPCSSSSPGVCSSSYPLSGLCYPTISSPASLFSFCFVLTGYLASREGLTNVVF